MIIPQTFIQFTTPVTLSLQISDGPRARVVPTAEAPSEREPTDMDFPSLPLYVQADIQRRIILAYLHPIAAPLPIYGPEDFAAACGDTMDEHAERVLEILGDDPALILQALIDGEELPDPPVRVPREVAHWRMEYVLGKMGKLPQLYEIIAALPDEQREIANAAWFGLAAINIKSPFIRLTAPLLGFSPQKTAELFIACAAIPA